VKQTRCLVPALLPKTIAMMFAAVYVVGDSVVIAVGDGAVVIPLLNTASTAMHCSVMGK
jgi:hypothetical protein